MEPNLENKCVRDDSQTSTLSKKMQKKIQNGAKKSGKWQQTQIWWGSLRSTPSGQQVGAGGGDLNRVTNHAENIRRLSSSFRLGGRETESKCLFVSMGLSKDPQEKDAV